MVNQVKVTNLFIAAVELYLFLKHLAQWFPTWGEFPPRGEFEHFRGGIWILKNLRTLLTFLNSCKLHVYTYL